MTSRTVVRRHLAEYARKMLLLAMCGFLFASGFRLNPALAHHGWDEFDTSSAYYMAGTITSVSWASPHIHIRLRIEHSNVPAGFADRALPAGLDRIGGRDVLQAAQPYTGGQEEVNLELASVEVQAGWGLDRPLRVGERVELVAFPSRDEDDTFRAEVIFLEDGSSVRERWQSLPVVPKRPDQRGGLSTAPRQFAGGEGAALQAANDGAQEDGDFHLPRRGHRS